MSLSISQAPLRAIASTKYLQVPSLSLRSLGGVRWQSGKKKAAAAASSSRSQAGKPISSADARGGASKNAGAAQGSKGGNSKNAASAAASSSTSNSNGGGVEGDIVFHMRGVTKTLPGGRVLFKDISLAFQRGAKIGVLGLNGAGKSSLLKILAGIDTEFDGDRWCKPATRVGYLAQEPVLDENRSVHENIMDGLKEKTDLLEAFEACSAAMAEPDADIDGLLEQQSTIQTKIDEYDCWNLAPTIAIAKRALRVPPDDADVKTLSGGERRRVALCRLLLEQPDVLFLDEPTNHLDAESVAWLEQFLKAYRGTVLAITHDRYFLDNVAGWILEVDRGAVYPMLGNYSTWLARKAERLDLEKRQERKKAKAMQEELAWIRQGAKARQAKSKSRVAAFDAMVADREASRSTERFLSGQIVIPPGPRLGDSVVDVSGLTHALEDGRKLFNDVSFTLPKGAIVGIIGGNGAGKSTLLKMIAGDAAPQSGRISVGSTVRIGLVSQSRGELGANERVLDVVGGGSDFVSVGDFEMPLRQYLAGFNIVGELQSKMVRSLSGGERNRVHLARALRHPCNLLMLDEPTNDLDVDTLRSLEEALDDFCGCALIVSHDRYFIDRVATHLLVFRGAGAVEWFEGNFSEYEADCAAKGLPPPGVALAQGASSHAAGEAKAMMPQLR